MPSIELANIEKRFGSNVAVSGFNLLIPNGRRLMLLGPSGAGKTTLLRLLAGLEKPDQGTILVDGTDAQSISPHRRSLALVSQDYALYPQLNVRKNLETALARLRLGREVIEQRIDETLGWFQITELSSHLPSQLSGGEAQRAALAKALVTRPGTLLLDEPLSQVDGILKVALSELIRDCTREFGCTTVMVTHDPLDAMRLADNIAIINGGRLVEHGIPQTLYSSPRSSITASLLSPFGLNWLPSDPTELEQLLPASAGHMIKRDDPTLARGFRPEAFQLENESEPESAKPSIRIEAPIEDLQNLGFAWLAICKWRGLRVRLMSQRPFPDSSFARGCIPIDDMICVKE